MPLIETVFQASEKWFLPFTRYSRQWKKFLPQMETFFFDEFFIPASENLIQSHVEDFKIQG